MVRTAKAKRAYWLKQLHTWHWVSSAACLIGMLLFAVTGITLNHAGAIAGAPKVSERTATLPAPLIRALKETPEGKAPVPAAVAGYIVDNVGAHVEGKPAEWSEDEVYIPLPRPGGDAWVLVDRATGEVVHEISNRGWISYLNDLHKGRNTGAAWSWFIDIFAVACLVFCLTGLILLQLHARHRPMTWPMVGIGLVIPALVAILFIHM